MSTRQIVVTIFLLFLSPFLLHLLLQLPGTDGASNRIHDLSCLGNKREDEYSEGSSNLSFNKGWVGRLLGKGFPLPPSAPSKRHDAYSNGGASVSATDGLRV
ncbi:hypothetical protein V6N13_020153 [Hibiscus sabdariffa]|uniref:Uncharacterized protein n=1 Tax=Hibiscus sabdariffa TaxID=183260 RepID=A0ABR2ESM1_9ROSI